MKQIYKTANLFAKQLLVITAVWLLPHATALGASKEAEKETLLLSELHEFPLDGVEQGGFLSANNDTAYTSPAQKVSVDVILNDVLTCNDPHLTIISSTPSTAVGSVSVHNDYIVFTSNPLDTMTRWVNITYSITCNGMSDTAVLAVFVSRYNTPLNIVPQHTACVEVMPERTMPFKNNIRLKYSTNPNYAKFTAGYNHGLLPDEPIQRYRGIDVFTSPMVGDLNGDGKPEIVMLGVATTGTYAPHAYSIDIFNGQDGTRLFRHPFGGTNSTSSYSQHPANFHRSPSKIALADVDGDGKGEIIEAGSDGMMRAYQPVFNAAGTGITSMRELWSASIPTKAPITSSVFAAPNPYIVDLNGDGIPEVIVYNKIYNAQTGELLMSWRDSANIAPKYSSVTQGATLYNTRYYTTPATLADARTIRGTPMIGRRPGIGAHSDRFVAVPAVWDIDGDGQQEIITGSRIHKFTFNYLGKRGEPRDHTYNYYRTIEGPRYVDLPEGSHGGMKRLYLSDGFTRVADIDGDGYLDIIVISFADDGSACDADPVKVLIYVWDPRYPNTVKAALTYRSSGVYGAYSIPFVGDINGKLDGGWNGSVYTKRLPEICILSGTVYINREYAPATGAGRTGIKFHPLSDELLRQGAIDGPGSVATPGWNNNNTTSSERRFNKARSGSYGGFQGHIIGLTYDNSSPNVWEKLKLSWGMEHSDMSNNTGITLFDFDNDGAKDLCYRDETTLRVISPAKGTHSNGQLPGRDYVALAETESTAGTSIMFSTPVFSGTGFEYPVIADVNLDGSADILVTHCNHYGAGAATTVLARGWINVYEYKTEKWAPAPPVWNQAMYNPLHINEDLTVPVCPQPMLTQYTIGQETITPYNGSWIQQPIVLEGSDYKPVYRLPDAVITDMSVTVDVNNNNKAKVIVTIRNSGTASLNANTPITFYKTTTPKRELDANATPVFFRTLGTDLFPNEKLTIECNLTGSTSYDAVTVWVRLMDSLRIFPATGYADCDFDNNSMAAIDCPTAKYDVLAEPNTVICGGPDAGVILKANIASGYTKYGSVQRYRWYNERGPLKDSDTLQTYWATQPGMYRCYVWDSICIGFTRNTVTLTKDNSSLGDRPDLTAMPDTIPKICGVNGTVYLAVNNYNEGSNTSFTWFKDGNIVLEDSRKSHFAVTQEGLYQVVVKVGSCAYRSDTLRITSDPTNPVASPRIENVYNDTLCTMRGGTVLQVIEPQTHRDGLHYQWFKDGNPLSEKDTLRWYISSGVGRYYLLMTDENNCSAFSDTVILTKITSSPPVKFPQIRKYPDTDTICADGGVLLSVINISPIPNIRFEWWKNGVMVQGGSSRSYAATEAGYYFVVYIDGNCVSVSDQHYIYQSNVRADSVEIESANGLTALCGNNSSLVLRVKTPASSGQTYRWLKNNQAISGGTQDFIVVNDTGVYTLQVINASCSFFSNEILITLSGGGSGIDIPEITAFPAVDSVCANGVTRLEVSNANKYPNTAVYTWYRDGIEMQSSTGSVYFASGSGIYYVHVTIGGLCGATSEQDTLSISPQSIDTVKIATYPESENICGNNGVVLIKVVNKADYPNAAYQWYKNGEAIPGDTTAMCMATDTGTYFVHILTGICGAKSREVQVSRTNTHIASIVLDVYPDNVIRGGVPVDFTLDNKADYSSSSTRYIWFRGTDSVGNTADYSTNVAGVYRLLVIVGNCATMSDAVELRIDGCTLTEPTIASIPVSEKLCGNGGGMLLYVTNHAIYDSPVYEWVYNGTRNGTVGTTCEPDSIGTYSVIVNDEGCSSQSTGINVKQESTNITKPTVTKRPIADALCGANGKVILELSNAAIYGQTATYLWLKDNYAIAGATQKIYEVTQPGNYRVVVLDGECAALSTIDTIVLNPNKSIDQPILTKNPNQTAICQNGSIRYDVQDASSNYAAGSIYVWYRADSVVQEGGKSYYVANQSGKYFVQVIEGSCSATSARDSLSRSTASIAIPSIHSYPASQAICGDTGVVVLRVMNTSAYQNTVYQWYKDGYPIAGATNVLYSVTEAGDYFVQIEDVDCGVVSSPEIAITKTVTVIDKARISASPASAQISSGNAVGLQLDNPIYGGSAEYIWFKGNDSVGTGTQYSASVVGIYRLLVITGSCAVWSNSINVTDAACTIPSPVIASIPSVGICGDDGRVLLRLSNRVDYVSPSYQWYNGNNLIAGAVEPALEVTATGNYLLEVIDTGCMARSSVIPITLIGNTSIDQPIVNKLPNVNELCGSNGRIMLSLSSPAYSSSASYQWLKDNYEIQGATSQMYEVKQPGKYRLMVQDAGCMSLSDVETIIQNTSRIEIPVLSKLPDNDSVCTGGSIRYSVFNTGQYPQASVEYVWYKNNVVVQHSSSPHYVAESEGVFFVQVISGNCSAISVSDTLSMSGNRSITAPVIAAYPSTNIICGDDGVVVLHVTNKGIYQNPTYLWYRNNMPIANSNTSMYMAKDSGLYFVQVFEGECAAISGSFNVIKTPSNSLYQPQLSYNPPEKQIRNNVPVVITVDNPLVDPNIHYIWFYENDSMLADVSSYSAFVAGMYSLLVVEGGCAMWSGEILISQDTCNFTAPSVTTTPSSQKICGDNGNVLINIDNTSSYVSPVSYTWYRNDTLISGATQSYYIAEVAGSYRIFIDDDVCSGYSQSINITKDNNSTIAPCSTRMTPSSGVICGTTGSVVLILTNMGDYLGGTYQWYKDGRPLLGANSPTQEVFEAGTYWVHVLLGNCGVISGSLVVTENPNGSLTEPLIASSGMKICGANGRVLLTVTNANIYSNATYQWFRNNLLINNATQSTYEVSLASTYRVQVVSNDCGVFSDTIDIIGAPNTRIAFPEVEVIPSSKIVCQPHGSALLRLSNDTAYQNPVYQWYNNNVPIVGANQPWYKATDRGIYRIEVKEGDCTTLSTEEVLTRQQSLIVEPIVEAIPSSKIICATAGSVMLKVSNYMNYNNAEYIWYRGNVELQRGTSEVYVATQPGDYMVLVVEGNCSSMSAMQTLTSSPSTISQAQISSMSGSAKLCGVNGTVVLSLNNETDFSQASYQWYRYGEAIPQATGTVYAASDTGEYRLVVTEGYCTSVSNMIFVTYDNVGIAIPRIVSNPTNGYIYGNAPVDLTIQNETDFSNPTYRWYRDASVLVGNQKDLTTNVVGKYRLLVMEGNCSAWSNEIILRDTTCNPPTLVSSLHGGIICSGDVFTYTALSDYPAVTYQWKRLPNPAINGGDSAVGTSQAIREILTNTSMSSVIVSYEFILTSTDGSCSTASPIEMIVEVLPADHIQVQLLNRLCYGDTVVFIPYQTQQTASMEYKIFYGGEALGVGFVPMSQYETLPPSFIEIKIPSTALPGVYAASIEIKTGTCIVEYPFSIVIAVKPVIINLSPSTYYCEGETMTLTVTASGNNLSYQWYYEGNPINGATSPIYEKTFLPSMEGEYYVEVSNACTTVTSEIVEVELEDRVVVDTKWEDIIYVNAAGQNYVRYQWYKNGEPIAVHGSSQYYVAPNGLVGDYHVRVYFVDGSYLESCPVSLNLPKVAKNLLYPTPVARGEMYIIELMQGNDDDQTSTVEIYDATGRLIDKHIMEGAMIEIQATYARGVYSVKIIRSNREIVIKRLIVE
jgi:membrane carboxypeptidase/penicillin-binding protein PbpC